MKMRVGVLRDVGHDLREGMATILASGVRVRRGVARRVVWMNQKVLTFTFMTASSQWVR